MDLDGANQNGPGAGEDGSRKAGQVSGSSIGLEIRRGLRAQSLSGLLLAAALLTVSPVAAYSSLLGSLAAFIPAVFFAVRVAARIGEDSAAFLQAAVVGEALKLLLTALICMAVFLWVKPLAAGWFFAGMILAIAAGILARVRGLDI